jgi:uncharacterized membrane protein YsdA (DUF1294 family)
MEQIAVTLAAVYLLLMNLAGFLLMGADKRRAVKKAWRIPERTLLLTAFLGGGIGSMLGMYAFRHKTKRRKFALLLPVMALLDILLILKLYP